MEFYIVIENKKMLPDPIFLCFPDVLDGQFAISFGLGNNGKVLDF